MVKDCRHMNVQKKRTDVNKGQNTSTHARRYNFLQARGFGWASGIVEASVANKYQHLSP